MSGVNMKRKTRATTVRYAARPSDGTARAEGAVAAFDTMKVPIRVEG
jgi:hypothetical protein